MSNSTHEFLAAKMDSVDADLKTIADQIQAIDDPEHRANATQLCALKRIELQYLTLSKELKIALAECK